MNEIESDPQLAEAAQTKNRTLFNGLMPDKFDQAMIGRYTQNDKFFKEIFADEDKMNFLKTLLFEEAYRAMSKKKNGTK